MKKILFVIPEYSHGGTNKSLENLLYFLDKEKYEISIYCLYEDGGDYYKKVFAPYILKKSRLYYWLHDNVFTRKITGLYNKLTRQDTSTFLYKRETRLLKQNYDFDTIVAYQEGTATLFVSYFNNQRKIAWIHCDYRAWSKGIRRKSDECYTSFDNIVCVSKSAMESFCSLFPELTGRVHVVYNLLNGSELTEKAKMVIDEDTK